MPVSKAPAWATTLRATIKQDLQVLKGLTISEKRGTLMVELRNARYGTGRKRFASIPWTISQKDQILETLRKITRLMTQQSRDFKEACHAVDSPLNQDPTAVNWPAVIDSLFVANSGWRPKTKKDHASRAAKFLSMFEDSKNAPRDARQVFRQYAMKFFPPIAVGSPARGRHFDTVQMILSRAVEHYAADPCWVFNDPTLREELIGHSVSSGAPTLKAPVKDEELAVLLDALRNSDPELYLAVALVAIHGLRPAELAVFDVNENEQPIVWNNIVKRNRRTMNKKPWPRLALPLDIPGRNGEGRKVFDMWRKGLVKLPNALLNAIDRAKKTSSYKQVGDAFHQLLERNEHWQNLLMVANVTPYSLRHSYAWRGHRSYGISIPVRDMAAMMGHSVQVHQKDYGSWVDDVSLLSIVAKATEENEAQVATSRYI